jgi:hypothetical protein
MDDDGAYRIVVSPNGDHDADVAYYNFKDRTMIMVRERTLADAAAAMYCKLGEMALLNSGGTSDTPAASESQFGVTNIADQSEDNDRSTDGVDSHVPTGVATTIPRLFSDAGELVRLRYAEFFRVKFRSDYTRTVYGQNIRRFCRWCDQRNLQLEQLSPDLITGYIDELTGDLSVSTANQHLSAIRKLFKYLVAENAIQMNPTTSVRRSRRSSTSGQMAAEQLQVSRLGLLN